MSKFEDENEEFNEDLEDVDFDDLETITMTDEDGSEIEFYVVDELEYSGAKYLLVVEAEGFDDDEADAIILKETGQEDEEIIYEAIEDDNEFKAVSEMFSANLDDGDYEIEL